MDDAAFRAAEEPLERAIRGVVQDVVLTVAIQDVELAIGAVQCPRGTVIRLLGVFAGIRRQAPFAELLAGEGEPRHRVQAEVGDEECVLIAMTRERETVRAGELRPRPFVRQLTGVVVEDDVVRDVVGQQDDLSVSRAGEPVAIVDRRLVIEHAPAGDDAILEVALAEDFG